MESPFRDDREAAHMRAEQLVEENEQLRRELAEAKKPKLPPLPVDPPKRMIMAAVSGGLVAVALAAGAALFWVRSPPRVNNPVATDGKEHISVKWVSEPSPTTDTLRGVWTNGRDTYAVGENGVFIYRTPSGVWSSQRTGTTATLNCIVSGAATFAVGDGGTILRFASETRSWMTEKSGTNENLYGVTLSEGSAVAVGSNGTVLVRGMDEKWKTVPTPTHEDLHAVGVAGGLFAVGNRGTILFGLPDREVVAQQTGTAEDLRGIVSAASEIFTVGSHGTVLRASSASAVPWASERSEAQSDLLAAAVVHAQYASRSAGYSATGSTNAVLAVGRRGVYLVDNLHAKNGFEVGVVQGGADLLAVGASGSEAFAVGAKGTIVHGSF
ncbi:MAG: hypothetical protein ABIP39_02090 [Polyangiaceae bacterium]